MNTDRKPLPLTREIFDIVYQYSRENPRPLEPYQDEINTLTELICHDISSRREAEQELMETWFSPVIDGEPLTEPESTPQILDFEKVVAFCSQLKSALQSQLTLTQELWDEVSSLQMIAPSGAGANQEAQRVATRYVSFSDRGAGDTEIDFELKLGEALDGEDRGHMSAELVASQKVSGEPLVFDIKLNFIVMRDGVAQEVITSERYQLKIRAGRTRKDIELGRLLADHGYSLNDEIEILPEISHATKT